MDKPKAKVYIDGANIFYTQKSLNWTIELKLAADEYIFLEDIKKKISR